MMNEPVTRPSLLLRLRDARDAEAWSMFVEVYLPLVYHYLRRHGLQDADAADVAQEVLRSVAGAMPGFAYDTARGSFRGWLLTATRRRAAAWHKRQNRRHEQAAGSAVAEWADDKAQHAEERQWEEEFQHCLLAAAAERVRKQVEPQTWEAFHRTSFDGLPAAEVAASLGMTVGAVYVARSRVTGRLKQELALLSDE
jgi:RNA polymerase sigma factor (sigma-70 family)